MDESRKKFEEYVAKKLRLPFEMITEARNGDRYFAFSSMDIRHSLNEWWTLWQASRAAIEITAPKFVGWREKMKSAPAADVEILNDEQSTKQIKDDNEDKI